MPTIPKALLIAILFPILFCQGCAQEKVEDWGEEVHDVPIIGTIYAIPDVDMKWTTGSKQGFISKFFLGSHRSWLTHSCVFVFVVAFCLRKLRGLGALITLIVGLIFAFHFFCDLFPRGYQGGLAYIHFPLYLGSLTWIPFDWNWIPWIVSKVWLLANIVLCIVAAAIPLGREDGSFDAAS